MHDPTSCPHLTRLNLQTCLASFWSLRVVLGKGGGGVAKSSRAKACAPFLIARSCPACTLEIKGDHLKATEHGNQQRKSKRSKAMTFAQLSYNFATIQEEISFGATRKTAEGATTSNIGGCQMPNHAFQNCQDQREPCLSHLRFSFRLDGLGDGKMI